MILDPSAMSGTVGWPAAVATVGDLTGAPALAEALLEALFLIGPLCPAVAAPPLPPPRPRPRPPLPPRSEARALRFCSMISSRGRSISMMLYGKVFGGGWSGGKGRASRDERKARATDQVAAFRRTSGDGTVPSRVRVKQYAFSK